jgi:copper ion binding protein
MQNTTLEVTGMHCEMCESKIQKMVGKIDNVENVKADRESEKVQLEYDGSETTMDAVKQKIDDLGYKVEG